MGENKKAAYGRTYDNVPFLDYVKSVKGVKLLLTYVRFIVRNLTEL